MRHAIGLGLAFGLTANASVVGSIGDAELAEMATVVVVAETLAARVEVDEAGRPWTCAKLEVQERWKGAWEGDACVLGGMHEGYRLTVPGSPSFREGERAIWFLVRGHGGRWVPVGSALGKRWLRWAPGGLEPYVLAPAPDVADERFLPHPPERTGVRSFRRGLGLP